MGVLARLAQDARDPLFRSAYSLMGKTVLTALLGIGFWILAARRYPTELVGRSSALIAAMLTLSVVCQLNMGNAILRFVPTLAGGAGRALVWAYLVAAAGSLAGGSAFVLIAPMVAQEFAFLRDDPALAVAYALGTGLWSIFQLQDAALTALRQPLWVPAENALYGVLKIAALPVFASVTLSAGVLLSWVVPVAMLVAPVNYIVFRRALAHHRLARSEIGAAPPAFPRRRLGAFLAQDYVASVLNVAAVNLLPIVVIGLLGARETAYFYVPFLVVVAFDLLFSSVSASLTVEASFSEARLAEFARRIARRFGLLLALAVPAAMIAAPVLLLPFGERYSSEGTSVLRILLLASVFRAVVELFTTVSRVQRRATRMVVVHAALVAGLLGLSLVLGDALGSEGIALAWVGANAIVAMALLPVLARALSSTAA